MGAGQVEHRPVEFVSESGGEKPLAVVTVDAVFVRGLELPGMGIFVTTLTGLRFSSLLFGIRVPLGERELARVAAITGDLIVGNGERESDACMPSRGERLPSPEPVAIFGRVALGARVSESGPVRTRVALIARSTPNPIERERPWLPGLFRGGERVARFAGHPGVSSLKGEERVVVEAGRVEGDLVMTVETRTGATLGVGVRVTRLTLLRRAEPGVRSRELFEPGEGAGFPAMAVVAAESVMGVRENERDMGMTERGLHLGSPAEGVHQGEPASPVFRVAIGALRPAVGLERRVVAAPFAQLSSDLPVAE